MISFVINNFPIISSITTLIVLIWSAVTYFQQKRIAKRQYDFSIFEMRMNLRNELQKEFTFLLDDNNKVISANVDPNMVNIGRILNCIKFAFPKDKNLDKLIGEFRTCCQDIHRLAVDKGVIIESHFGTQTTGPNHIIARVLTYKDCIRTWSENGLKSMSITNQSEFNRLGLSKKDFVIIGGILAQYVDSGNSITEIEDKIIILFNNRMHTGQAVLNKIFKILDTNISL